jgi:translation initiation factor 2B subunit (eIF-2B alpha/beta/delta family)
MGSFHVAKQTAEVLRDILSSGKWASPKHALHLVRSVGSILIDASPVGMALSTCQLRSLPATPALTR